MFWTSTKYLLITACIYCFLKDSKAQVGSLNDGADSSGTPQTNIKVDKEYDQEGNLIRFDSVYSYSYSLSDTGLNPSALNFDSIFKNYWGQSWLRSQYLDTAVGAWRMQPNSKMDSTSRLRNDPFWSPFYDFKSSPHRFGLGSPLDIWNDFDLQIEQMRKRQEQMMDLFFYEQPNTVAPQLPKREKEKPENEGANP